MGRLAWCGLLLLHVGASFGVLALFNSEVETAWRPPRPHWSGQLQAIGRRQRRHLTRCLNRAWSQKQGPSLRLQGGRHWSGWPLRGQRVGEAQHPGPHVSGLHHAAASKHASSALWMDALLPTPAPLVDGGPMQPCGPTWTTMPLEPCRGRSPRLIVPPTAWTTVGYVAFWLPLDLMGPTLGAGLQPGTLQHLLRRQQLLATVVALIWPPFFWQTFRYFGTCPKSLARRGPNALPELWPQ